MTDQVKTPEVPKNVADVKPNDATPVPEKGNVAPINTPKAPAPVGDVKPASDDKERKHA